MDNKKKLNKNKTKGVVGGDKPHIPMLVLKSYCSYCKEITEVDSFTLKTEKRWVPCSAMPASILFDVSIRTCTVCGKQTEWVENHMLRNGIL